MIKKIATLLKIMYQYVKRVMVIKLLIAVFQGILITINMKATQLLVDHMVGFINKKNTKEQVIFAAAILGCVILADVFFAYINEIVNVYCERLLTNNFEPKLIDKFQKVSYSCFEDSDSQDIIRRVSEQPYLKIKSAFLELMNTCQIVFSIIGMCTIYIKVSVLLIIALVVIMIPLVWTNFVTNNSWWNLYFSQTKDERRNRYFNDLMCTKNSLAELKAFQAVPYIVSIWKKSTSKMLDEKQKVILTVQKYMIIKNVVSTVWYIAAIGFSIYYYFNHMITIGLLVSVIQSTLVIVEYADGISSSIGKIIKDSMDIQYYNEFLKLPDQIDASKQLMKQTNGKDGTTIEFKNVKFKYPNTDKYVLNGVSFCLNMNENIVLVGGNGAGKSTIVKLLCKLYEPTEGEILVNGININDISYDELSSWIGVVFQDYYNYELSIRENVGFGCISKLNQDEDIKKALKMSGVEEIMSSTKGLDTNLGKLDDDGVDVSGGQWQRLALSRAYISDKPIIILDEPTAALDPLAESNMYTMFVKLMKQHSTIMISHRLSSSKIADKIIVLDKGLVVEEGNHEELMNKNKLYSQMFHAQASWYIGGEVSE